MFPQQRNTDQIVVFRSDGYLPPVTVATAGRAPVYERCEIRAVAQPTSSPFVVAEFDKFFMVRCETSKILQIRFYFILEL